MHSPVARLTRPAVSIDQRCLPGRARASRTRWLSRVLRATRGAVLSVVSGVIVPSALLFGGEPPVRSSENARPASLAPNDPALAPNLQLWFRADTLPLKDQAPVFRWPDYSGHRRDASPTIGVHDGVGTPPSFVKSSTIHGHPAVRFSQDNGLATPGDRPVDLSGDAALTIFVVANLKYQDASGRAVIVGIGEALDASNTTPGRPGAALLEIDRTPEGRHRLDHAGGFKRDALLGRPGSFTSSYDQPRVITLTKRPGAMRDTSSIFIDGEVIDAVPGSGTPASPDLRHRADFSVLLGRAHAVMGSLGGDIAEVLIYNRAFPDKERSAVEEHLGAKYGIPLSHSKDRSEPEPELVTEKHRQHWAFRKPVRPAFPALATAAPPVTKPIDAFLLQKLAGSGLTFSAQADPATLLRRIHLDLTGLPPAPEEIHSFIGKGSSEAYEQVVDGLLQSPHFGERWGRHWLDLAGYVDVTGNDQNAEQIILGESKWRYRDYVIRSFNNGKPWDRFLIEQIAGDELSDWRTADRFTEEHREGLIATGYLRTAIDDTHEVDLNKMPFRYQVLFDTMQIVGSSLFGLTLQCARCHDHKFDPIPQRDYYRLMALFTPALNAQAWLQPKDREVPDVSAKEQAAIHQRNAELERRIQPITNELARLLNIATNRVLDARLIELPATNRLEVKAAFEVPAEKRNETQKGLLKQFAEKLRVTAEDISSGLNAQERGAIESLGGIAATLTKQKQRWENIRAFIESGPPPRDFIFRRGDYEQRGKRVDPGLLAVLCRSESDGVLPQSGEARADSTGRRQEFARWLTDTNGAPAGLHARVWMNRCWQQLFGEPIVPTPDNFGASGLPPTDPALLDWLACEFIESGWQLKHMIKLMVMTQAYRQSSVSSPGGDSLADARTPNAAAADACGQGLGGNDTEKTRRAVKVDPENRLLWRQRMRRLESEIVRDTILAVSGKLDRTMFGPAVPIINLPDGSAALPSDDKMPTPTSRWRRSIYLLTRRNFHLPILSSFDQPILNTTCSRRMSSSVVLQPLTMLNDTFVVEQAGSMADRLAQGAPDSRQRIEHAFLSALGRKPAAEEIEWSLTFLAEQSVNFKADTLREPQRSHQAWVAFCQMLLNTSEFLYVN